MPISWFRKECGEFAVTKLGDGECFIWISHNVLLVFEKHTHDHQLQLGFNNDEDMVDVVGVDDV